MVDQDIGSNLEIVETLPPMHPGEVLREEFLGPLDLTAGRLAKTCGIARSRLERISAETLGISGDTALRLGRALGTTALFWMNLQTRYELECARAAIGDALEHIAPIERAA